MRPEDYMKTMVIEKVENKVMHNCGYLRKINRNLMIHDTIEIDDNLSKVINYFSVFMFFPDTVEMGNASASTRNTFEPNTTNNSNNLITVIAVEN